MKYFVYSALIAISFSCNPSGTKTEDNKPANIKGTYQYVRVDPTRFNSAEHYYVPVYNNTWAEGGDKKVFLNTTLSIRNIWFSDTLFISKVYYYGSNGELLRKYIDSTIMLKPMSSFEIIADRPEKEKGGGGNFIVECVANNMLNEPLIQSVVNSGNNDNLMYIDAVRINKPGR